MQLQEKILLGPEVQQIYYERIITNSYIIGEYIQINMCVLSNILPINEREQLYKTIETNDKNW